jgi:uncharacterized membrane protein
MADVITFLFGLSRAIFGFILILFIPGFLLSLVFFPRLSNITLIERFVYSVVMSIGSVITYVLFMDIVLGINTTPINIVIVLSGFCLVLTIIWIIRRFILTFSFTKKISDLTESITFKCAGVIRRIRVRWEK